MTQASNQQFAPADTPPRAAPRSQASRRARSMPCRRQTASMLAVLPPATTTTSAAATRSAGRSGIPNVSATSASQVALAPSRLEERRSPARSRPPPSAGRRRVGASARARARAAGRRAGTAVACQKAPATHRDDVSGARGHSRSRAAMGVRDDAVPFTGSAVGVVRGWRRMRYVYDFDEEAPGGRELLGGKGVGLAEMTALGVPVPGRLHDHDRCVPRLHGGAAGRCPDGLDDEVGEHIAALEQRSRASASATRPTRCSSPCARAPRSRCRG